MLKNIRVTKKIIQYAFISLTAILIIQACSKYYFRSNYTNANSLLHETKNLPVKPFLKAHLKNGDVCILTDTWNVDTTSNKVSGTGTRYNFNREIISKGVLAIPIDSVSLFETNKKIKGSEAGRIASLTVLTALDVIIAVVCITNPKACFGSCPTFYLNEHDNFHYADAEGFSNAILPSFEYADIDALRYTGAAQGHFSITMKNEALETHCVNDVMLLACPKKPEENIYQSPSNGFYRCQNIFPVTSAIAGNEDVTKSLKDADREERFSGADEHNLNSREEIYLNFKNVKETNELGLLLHFRQTLMTTYLFYSAMGYMGDEVSDLFTMLETDDAMKTKFDATTKKLGAIEVYAWNEQTTDWEFQDKFYETGPIAINRQLIPLNNFSANSDVRLKLVLNKGLWRIDYAALTHIQEKIVPLEILPQKVLNKGKLDQVALNKLIDPVEYLISMPGSEYKIDFELPKEHNDYELFLCSKGYYLEWMREHWIKDKNISKLKQMVDEPEKYLMEEAAYFKRYETTMEQEFWNSRIDTKTFSYHEN